MYLAEKSVTPISDYILILTFENGEKRQFDRNTFLDKGIFREPKNIAKFNSVRVSFDSIEWDNEADLNPEILYQDSVRINDL